MNQIKPVLKFSTALAAVFFTASTFAQEALPSWDEFAQVRQTGKITWLVDIDNDSLLFKKEDGFYTAGNKIGQSFTKTNAAQALTYGWRVGQELYTASDIKLTPNQISRNDHPYAGWLYAGIYREKNEASGQSQRLSLDLGCLGPCAGGEWTQTHLHRLLKQPLPQGWSTQLRNEWGAVLSGEYSPGRIVAMSNIDIAPRLKGRFGNIFTDASAELMIRAGSLNALPEQPASYGFLRTELKAVAYNASIQGGYFNNQATTVKPKSLVGEFEIGYLWRGENYGASASFIRRSNEIKELSNGQGAQNFARLQFIYAM
ncbi:lipid A deacylase LpxR family protein [Undibacterium sp. Di27W]|uniref:lipid A deacylase LpxR family protein n=1 Tax=Undibacterium sp. Di27W TaxID=3413036 RepID=UPI003BF25FCA